MGYSNDTATAASSTLDKLNPVPWIKGRWAAFVDLWPQILGLQHKAATLAATLPPGTAHDAARSLVVAAGDLAKLQAATQRKVETVAGDLGLGAVALGAASIVALSALAAIMLYCFTRYAALQTTLHAIEAGTVTPEQAQNLPGAGGPLPDLSVLGGVSGGLLLGAAAVLVGLFMLSRRRKENPSLVLFGANPQPEGVWSRRVLSLDYVHNDDGQAYTHSFRPDVSMQGLEDGSVRLFGRNGQRLWEDF